MKIPGIGLLFGAHAKIQTAAKIETAKKQFEAANKIRMKILVSQKRGENYQPLDIQRGIRPSEFWETGGKKFGTDLLLANTVEYAQLQIRKRYKKLGISDHATDAMMTGGAIALAAPHVGVGIASAGFLVQLAVKLKSGIILMTKLFTGALGRERNVTTQRV